MHRYPIIEKDMTYSKSSPSEEQKLESCKTSFVHRISMKYHVFELSISKEMGERESENVMDFVIAKQRVQWLFFFFFLARPRLYKKCPPPRKSTIADLCHL